MGSHSRTHGRARPMRLGPKRANKIRKLFNLDKETEDVRKFVVRRKITLRLARSTRRLPRSSVSSLRSSCSASVTVWHSSAAAPRRTRRSRPRTVPSSCSAPRRPRSAVRSFCRSVVAATALPTAPTKLLSRYIWVHHEPRIKSIKSGMTKKKKKKKKRGGKKKKKKKKKKK